MEYPIWRSALSVLRGDVQEASGERTADRVWILYDQTLINLVCVSEADRFGLVVERGGGGGALVNRTENACLL